MNIIYTCVYLFILVNYTLYLLINLKLKKKKKLKL